MKTLIRTACALAMLAAGFAAQAGTVTFNGWAHDNGNKVDVVSSVGNFRGEAGAFSITLAGFTGADSRFNSVFEAYCVELNEYISLPGGPYTNYYIVSASSYFAAKPGVADSLTRLISYANNGNLVGSKASGIADDQSTALQLAIWNTVYDTDKTLATSADAKLSDGTSFSTSTSGNFMNASDILASANAATGYSLYVLQAKGRQDQLIWTRNSVPEPTSLALVALALGGAGVLSRRRRG